MWLQYKLGLMDSLWYNVYYQVMFIYISLYTTLIVSKQIYIVSNQDMM